MNILIYFGNQLNPQNGGTERVACILNDFFQKQGHSVTLLCCQQNKEEGTLPSLCLPDKNESLSKRNITFVKELIKQKEINLILNEGGNGDAVYLFSHDYIDKCVKIITHLHFDVIGENKHFYKTLNLPIIGVSLRQATVNILKWIKSPYNKYITLRNKRRRFRFMLEKTDMVIVLSRQSIRNFMSLIGKGDVSKLRCLRNPITFNAHNNSLINKENKILFVGRLDYKSKRIDRVLGVWRKLYKEYPEWSLSIVGSGEDRERLYGLVKKFKLRNVFFEGKTDSEPFYRKSKILLMTSNYEGSPMVIPEAMANGVVPIVMDTFAGAHDVIVDGNNGCLTKPFDVVDMAVRVRGLMSDEKELLRLSHNAVNTISHLNNNDIFNAWDILINGMFNN